jgi:hypothetical protein
MTVAVDPRNARIVYMGFDNGLYKTTDAGAHWTAVIIAPLPGTDPPGDALNPVSLVIDPVRSNVVYLLVRNTPTPSRALMRASPGPRPTTLERTSDTSSSTPPIPTSSMPPAGRRLQEHRRRRDVVAHQPVK